MDNIPSPNLQIDGIHAVIRLLTRQQVPDHKLINHAFFVSLTSCIFTVVLGICFTAKTEFAWKVDPIAAFVLATCMLFEGIRVIYIFLDDVDFLLTKHHRP